MSGTRDALIAEATELVDAGGPSAVTLREVGARAGVSHNAPYKHFADKQTLLAAVAARELRAYTRLLAGHDGLVRVVETYIARALLYPRRFRLVFQEWTVESDELVSAASAAAAALDDLVAAAQQAGELSGSEPAEHADLLRATVHGAIELTLTGHLGKREIDRSPQDLTAALLGLLAPQPAPPTGATTL